MDRKEALKIIEQLSVQILEMIASYYSGQSYPIDNNTKIPNDPVKDKEKQGRRIRGSARSTSTKGIEIIKLFEGYREKPYLDAVGVLTVGYGHTSNVKGCVTPTQATWLLLEDLAKVEEAINNSVFIQLLQHEFDALASFIYNVGAGAFKKSTLLKCLNAGQKYNAASEFLKWDKAGGSRLEALTKRRRSERRMFLSGEYKGYEA
jgi:lysozyme